MAGLFSMKWWDPNARPRIEHRGGASVLEERIILVDRHGAEWRVVDYIGGDGKPMDQCVPSRRPAVNTQFRLFILQPLERSARLYAFETVWEDRSFTMYAAQRLQSQLMWGQPVRYPSMRPIDARSVITRGAPLHKPTDPSDS